MREPAAGGLVTAFALAVVGVSVAAENPRGILPAPGVERIETLPQNWTDDEANWFYDAGQGSRLVPYDWILALEQPGTEERFLADGHLRDLGLIPRAATPGNPDGLPVGLVRDVAYDDGTPALGMTCAACHTAVITHGSTSWVVDGGPAAHDLERFLRRLTAALEETDASDLRFARFAARVLPATADADDRDDLRASLRNVVGERRGYDRRNLSAPGGTPHGPGRIDAFGAIFNEVSATFLGVPGNVAAADAPVSYPSLWDTPQHDRVQWNGIAENRVSALGPLLFGTAEVGALGRNVGEVFGVFGSVRINEAELLLPRPYDSTAHKDNLLALEKTLATLWSPVWPAALGDLDEARITRGAALYRMHCIDCHALVDRTDPDRRVTAVMSDVGTDERVLGNAARVVATGRLAGRRRTLGSLERFDDTAPVAQILAHVVERAMLDPLPLGKFREALAGALRSADVVGPSFDEPAKGTYKARPLNGVWATAPYLHNGSVPTLAALLEPVARRPTTFHVGSTAFDPDRVGFVDDPAWPVFDTALPGNSNRGHEVGTELSPAEKHDLLEYLKSL